MVLYESSTVITPQLLTTPGNAYDEPLYRVTIPVVNIGDLLLVFAVAEISNLRPAAIMIASQIFLMGFPISPVDVQDATNEHVTFERHAIYRCTQAFTNATITWYGWATSDNYPLGTSVTVEDVYGKLSVLITS